MPADPSLPVRRNVFEDLSGTPSSNSSNPYDLLIQACKDDATQIQSRYQTHRSARNTKQKAELLSADFPGFSIDPVLHKLVHEPQDPNSIDTRHCLVFWARPPEHLRLLISTIQEQLRDATPRLWLMPLGSLHMTALEITHSVSASEIDSLVSILQAKIPHITDYTDTHRARLVKPMLSYDSSALALSFVPAAGEGMGVRREKEVDGYTYHHLRRDLYEICTKTGVTIASRYTVPSAHLTIGRFITQQDIARDGEQEQVDGLKVQKLVERIEEINAWLEREYWPIEGHGIALGGEWTVGEEKGLDCRRGTLWYGGGETIRLGKGF